MKIGTHVKARYKNSVLLKVVGVKRNGFIQTRTVVTDRPSADRRLDELIVV